MCGGFKYKVKPADKLVEMEKKVFFPIPHAQIPVITGEGVLEFCQWGKRKGEQPEIDVPQTGWARLGSLAEGKWNHYNPARVKIPALSWMEKDKDKQSHWFDMPDGGGYLQGVRIDRDDLSFVYVVTKEATGIYAEVHHRTPLVVG